MQNLFREMIAFLAHGSNSDAKTCPFIHNANKISGAKRSIKITDHFTSTSANVIYCINLGVRCTLITYLTDL